jgi:hypothetical protein
MSLEQIRSVHANRPFVPFTIHLASGQRVRVGHPECLSYADNGRSIAVSGPNEGVRILGVMLVESVELGYPVRNDRPN